MALQNGFASVFAQLPPEDAAKAQEDSARTALPDARACEIFKVVIKGAAKLPVGERESFIRALSQL